jgi:uncharacterized protein YuzE
MKEPYLEVTYRHGRPIAGYLYLPRQGQEKSARTERLATGLLVDFDAAGRPIGVEILTPSDVSAEAINELIEKLGLNRIPAADLAPLRAA